MPRLVFSSTAATYGEPEAIPITEDAPTRPTNTYGATKLAVDMMITGECAATDLAAVSLRYFNVAGAAFGAGERHGVETHLIPIALDAVAGRRDALTIYGDDWPTPDGTPIRDYVHVADLARAHVLALTAAAAGRAPDLQPGQRQRVQRPRGAGHHRAGHRTAGAGARSDRAGPATPPAWWPPPTGPRQRLGWTPELTLAEMVADAWEFSGGAGRTPRSTATERSRPVPAAAYFRGPGRACSPRPAGST